MFAEAIFQALRLVQLGLALHGVKGVYVKVKAGAVQVAIFLWTTLLLEKLLTLLFFLLTEEQEINCFRHHHLFQAIRHWPVPLVKQI